MKTLTDIIYQYKDTKLEFGNIDCCIFTAKVIEEYFNIDLPLWKDILTYKNYKGALLVLKQHNINSIEELPTAILGTDRKPIEEAKLGDVVCTLDDEGLPVLGVCNGKRAYFIHSEYKLVAVSIEKCLYCWSINND